MIVYFLNLGTSLEDYNYENQAIADIIKSEIGDVQFMGMSVRIYFLINVFGSSSIWTCRILNFEYRIFVVVFCRQAQWKKARQIFKIRLFQIDELPRTKVLILN